MAPLLLRVRLYLAVLEHYMLRNALQCLVEKGGSVLDGLLDDLGFLGLYGSSLGLVHLLLGRLPAWPPVPAEP